MISITAFLVITLLAVTIIPFVDVKGKAVVVYLAVILNTLISGNLAVQAFMGQSFEYIFAGSLSLGRLPIRLDVLSAWFILIINFIFITGGFYGLFYMKTYQNQRKNLGLHSIAFVMLHASLIALCAIQNGMVFLIAWEIMAISAFIAVIFEHTKIMTIKAGINYLIQSHVCIVFLMLGFMWAAYKTGSYDFQVIGNYTAGLSGAAPVILFLTFFVGFALKAGFVPFHTWLPYAHPAAPAHISGIMSGVLIKIGIYGILRMLLVIKPDFTIVGYTILIFAIVSGLYGVMLAIVQHDLKKLLAYHSIENIGIIGIGIGIGCIGLGENNLVVASLGFAGALLHTWNHALFKSLLFFTAGNIYQATHTLNIEQLGGLVKKMPQTAYLFLIASIAICGIPPFNGFISEFILYSGMYYWIQGATMITMIASIFTILGLVLIGGLALLCFTKAFSVVFLGNERHSFDHEIKEVPQIQLIPLYMIAFFILIIGVFPQYFIGLIMQPVALITGSEAVGRIFENNLTDSLQHITLAVWGFILLILTVFLVRKFVQPKRMVTYESTWACAYEGPAAQMQYTAGSFVRSYSKLLKPVIMSVKREKEIHGIFPSDGFYVSHSYDKLEKWLIDKPIMAIKSFMGRFRFLQNGKLQFYILYGILFIVSIVCIPIIYETIIQLIGYFKHI
jgi:formate hydrogenlyase subunit 3/multisubunit Na+/H+ antiporter MnhD subunit